MGSTSHLQRLTFLTTETVVRNVFAVPYLISGVDSNAESLRRNFFVALNSVQSTPLRWQERPLITFENDKVVDHLLQKKVWVEGDEDIAAFPLAARPRLTTQTEEALDLLTGLSADVADLIDLTISEFCLMQKAGRGGGSVSSLIGAVWINPQPEWSVPQLAEVIFHEWVHHVLFLEDMVQRIFKASQDEMDANGGLVRSAILRTPRSLDKSFHSLAVALATSWFREAIGQESGARQLRSHCGSTIADLHNKQEMLTEHGRGLLDEMASSWRTAV